MKQRTIQTNDISVLWRDVGSKVLTSLDHDCGSMLVPCGGSSKEVKILPRSRFNNGGLGVIELLEGRNFTTQSSPK